MELEADAVQQSWAALQWSLPAQTHHKKRFTAVPETICLPKPRVCIILTNKMVVLCYSELFLWLSQVSFHEIPNVITLFRLLSNWLNTIN